ncbi:hypothetical protein CR513_57575, partial [Mucuna pruriens]
MKILLWIIVRETTIPKMHKAMGDLNKMNEATWRDMMEIHLVIWAKSHFDTYIMCDLQVNNMCEALNKAILEHKGKSIISLFGGIKLHMTNKFVSLRGTMLKYNWRICLMIQQILEKAKREVDGWYPNWTRDINFSIFKITNNHDKHIEVEFFATYLHIFMPYNGLKLWLVVDYEPINPL